MPSTDDPVDAGTTDESTHVATFDPDGDRASETVVTAVAALAGTSPIELEPLYEAIEPDALDALVDHARRDGAGTHELWFRYEGYDVGVWSDGEVRIRDERASTTA